MSEFNSQNLTIKQKILAFQQLETTLGRDKTRLSITDRLERKRLMRSMLGIEPPQVNYDIEYLKSLVANFFKKLDMDQKFTNIEIKPLPKDMFISIEGDTLTLEQDFIERATPDLRNIIIIHEMYHNFFQNMRPDMTQVKHLRDYFGQQTITEMDIDADIETFLFFKEFTGLEFSSYVEILFSSMRNRPDNPIVRVPKIVRSAGSLISIYVSQKSGIKQILVPDLHQINVNEHYMACISNGRKYAKTPSIKPLVNLHLQPSKYSPEEFVAQVTSFCEDMYICLKPQLKF